MDINKEISEKKKINTKLGLAEKVQNDTSMLISKATEVS
jgi:hypothetical protein